MGHIKAGICDGFLGALAGRNARGTRIAWRRKLSALNARRREGQTVRFGRATAAASDLNWSVTGDANRWLVASRSGRSPRGQRVCQRVITWVTSSVIARVSIHPSHLFSLTNKLSTDATVSRFDSPSARVSPAHPIAVATSFSAADHQRTTCFSVTGTASWKVGCALRF
jgi:hypothetical protein